jgi:hypothetical protein
MEKWVESWHYTCLLCDSATDTFMLILWPGCNLWQCSIGSEVLKAVVIKRSVFWNITPCNLLEVNRRFGRTCRLHLQGRHLLSRRFLAGHIRWHWRWRYVHPKRQLTFSGLHGVVSQKLGILLILAPRGSQWLLGERERRLELELVCRPPARSSWSSAEIESAQNFISSHHTDHVVIA